LSVEKVGNFEDGKVGRREWGREGRKPGTFRKGVVVMVRSFGPLEFEFNELFTWQQTFRALL